MKEKSFKRIDKIRVEERYIGEGEPCFIVAEAGVNHNGDVDLAKKLIAIAKEAGADAVKFQTFRAEELATKSTAGESHFNMLKRLELSRRDLEVLSAYTHDMGIIFLSSPFDRDSVDFLDVLGVPVFKIASGEITNFPLLKHIAGKGRPIILSTGMSLLEEIRGALAVIRKGGVEDIILLHCVTSYPAKIEEMNLKTMATLRNTFKLPVGLSDHSLGVNIPIAAVAMGACLIEKHFTLNKNLPGPDHGASLEPDELKQMVRSIKDAERAMGNGVKKLTNGEEENKKVARRSIVASVDIPEGTIITDKMLDIKRPGTGIELKDIAKVIGQVSRTNIKKDEPLAWDKVKHV